MREYADIGEKIKILRKARGLTQEQLAELIGIDEKHLSRLEKGYHSPNYTLIKKLALALDIKLFPDIEQNYANIQPQDKITKKVLNIFKSAETENEKLCYLEAIKNAQKCFKLGQHSFNLK